MRLSGAEPGCPAESLNRVTVPSLGKHSLPLTHLSLPLRSVLATPQGSFLPWEPARTLEPSTSCLL